MNPVTDAPELMRRAPGSPSRLGPQALQTRSVLLDALEQYLWTTGWREISAPRLAERAGCSPATFYQYFADLEEAFDALRARLAEEGRAPDAHTRLIADLVDFERQRMRPST